MGREFRFRVSGAIFFIITLLHLFVTRDGKALVINIVTSPNDLQVLITIASGAFIFFASDSIGYIFSTIFLFFFNTIVGGYAGIYKKKIRDLGKYITETYDEMKVTSLDDKYSKIFRKRLQLNNTEHIFVYFFWNCKDGANEYLQQWIERRHTAYFTSYGTVIAIIAATIISNIVITSLNWTPTSSNFVIFISSFVFVLISIVAGELAMKDSISILNLHLASFINPKIIKIIQENQHNKNCELNERKLNKDKLSNGK